MTVTLHVEPATTQVSESEIVTDGFKVLADGEKIYQSRNPLKAVIKAVVLTADERFAGASVTFAEGVAELAGKLNLALMLDADRFNAIRAVALAEPPVEEIVGAIKANGNNAGTPDAD